MNKNSTFLNNKKVNFNGRVNITDSQSKPWELFQQCNLNNNLYKQEAVKTIQTSTPLSNAFFSKENIDIIQNNIRYTVWLKSGKKHIISRQSDIQLQIIMRSVFLQNSKHLPTNIKGQILNLNSLVINYSVPKILSAVEQFICYKQTVSTLPQPMTRPEQTSIKGEKTLELKNFM